MTKKLCLLAGILGAVAVLGLSLGVTPAWSEGLCPGPSPCSFRDFRSVAPTLPGRPARLSLITLCYNTFFGQPVGCGNVFTRILGLAEPSTDQANNGGHQHDFETHPVTAPPPNDKLAFDLLQFDPKLGFGTGPVFGLVIVANFVPEVAGQLVYEWLVRVPLGALCAANCFDPVHGRTLLTLDVGVPPLVELEAGPNCKPSPPDVPFIICRELTDTHPKGTHGTPGTIARVRILAEAYEEATGGKLSINDISLPRGGVFDLCDTFNPADTCPAAPKGGHKSHRAGRDVDINSQDAEGVATFCLLYSQDLQDALLDSGVRFLVCHKGGASHVQF